MVPGDYPCGHVLCVSVSTMQLSRINAKACCISGAAVIVGSSRQTYAFARDGAMPFSNWLAKLTKSKVPANAVWFNILFSAILGIPYLFSEVAFETIVSINTIAASISYFIPIWLRITMARKRFQKGPFHLGVLSVPCGIIACAWIFFTSALFILPTVSHAKCYLMSKTNVWCTSNGLLPPPI